ncbi:MAG: pilus assembly protein TadG-related protein [Phycisphaerae bacterium]
MLGKKLKSTRRGVVAVQVVVALPVLLGFAAISVDVGVLYNARSEMQRAADSAALAAIADIAYSQEDVPTTNVAIDSAVNYVDINPILGRHMQLDTQSDVLFGRAYYDEVNNAYNFVGGDLPINAARVTVRHSDNSPNGKLPLYFAALFGKGATDLSADATAIYVGTEITASECGEDVPEGLTMMCLYGDSDDSDDSQGEFGDPDSDDSDDSDTGDSDGAHNGDSDDSDDSEAGDSDDSDDSADSDSGEDSDSDDSENGDSSFDSDGPFSTLVDAAAVPIFLSRGGELGSCDCITGDSDDSDDSQGEFGPADSVDSDDSDPGDSDGSTNGDIDDSDDSQGEFGPADSDDSDDSDPNYVAGAGGGDSDSGGGGAAKVTICHIPPGNPANPQTISIAQSAVAAHMMHGDDYGICEDDVKIKIFLIE